ncbi:hypothetical protein PSPTOT1_1177 [Pseudomonas syringae pv. tomato T1]|nr:hypothetical protein PSPTOT1_1177 [Pseudomonas syringae pv. tomato T1]
MKFYRAFRYGKDLGDFAIRLAHCHPFQDVCFAAGQLAIRGGRKEFMGRSGLDQAIVEANEAHLNISGLVTDALVEVMLLLGIAQAQSGKKPTGIVQGESGPRGQLIFSRSFQEIIGFDALNSVSGFPPEEGCNAVPGMFDDRVDQVVVGRNIRFQP